jgi:uncharacterized protein YjbI with pentapeptide repeats
MGITFFAIVGGLIIYSYADWQGAQYFGIADKKFWNYLDLLIVPAALAIGVYLLNRAQSEREREAQAAQRRRELAVAKQRAQDEALQAYLDQMSKLLLDKNRPLLESKTDSAENFLAKARTLTVLTRLNGERKRSVVDFLFEASLICKNCKGLGDWPLKEANLRKAHLGEAHLVKTNLSHARLSEADLKRADLRGADLRGANLSKAVLSGARFGPPSSEGEDGEPDPTPANLSGANLSGADLSDADLSDADLSDADFSDADLSGAKGVTEKQLELAQSLKNATMPNRQKYEDWFKDKRLINCLGDRDLPPDVKNSKPKRTAGRWGGQRPVLTTENELPRNPISRSSATEDPTAPGPPYTFLSLYRSRPGPSLALHRSA